MKDQGEGEEGGNKIKEGQYTWELYVSHEYLWSTVITLFPGLCVKKKRGVAEDYVEKSLTVGLCSTGDWQLTATCGWLLSASF